ncbi:peroxisomal biogenesis factor 11 [Ceratobasidium sp. AG-Ba]|nr:peroxisomal biogenesis factor 11 [Ceratobasidium sp. AG-Ba]QRW03772.1 peroxisomal biogenesis factor 11 [Ceratobasidium sp. AG-Ba]
MSGSPKPMTVTRLTDILLGSVGTHLPPSKRIDHAVRYLSTWSGSDKFFMIIQYASKLVAPYFLLRAKLQYKAGLAKSPESFAATALNKLGSNISSARTLWNFWGLLPIFQWLTSLERSQPRSRKLLNIERLQALAMLAYYPIEHLYYLGGQSIIRLSPKTTGRLAIWSCRIWLAYIVLQFEHLREDMRLLKIDEKIARNARKGGEVAEEDVGRVLVKRKAALWNQLLSNVGNFPLAIHWSLEKGLFGNETWVNLFGLIAALASFRGGWAATAAP